MLVSYLSGLHQHCNENKPVLRGHKCHILSAVLMKLLITESVKLVKLHKTVDCVGLAQLQLVQKHTFLLALSPFS